MEKPFDLLTTIEYGGCSSKLPAGLLSEMLKELPVPADPDLLVSATTHDDAGVYRISEDTALIFTTDFFPPICSDPFEFGEIAAANALSDVYAMAGTPLLVLNLVMLSPNKVPMEVFSEILRGGEQKVREAGGLVIGGHTIDDHPPKYGLAVIGTVHPEKLITNAGARPGERLILTKPIGTGAVVSGQRNDLVSSREYREALACMKSLNSAGARAAGKYGCGGMTDITGFGLAGHALKMAEASKVSFRINTRSVPILEGAFQVFEKGSIPGVTFRNQEFTGGGVHFTRSVPYSMKMLVHDAQTSGGLLMTAPADLADMVLDELNGPGSGNSAMVIGEVLEESPRRIYFE